MIEFKLRETKAEMWKNIKSKTFEYKDLIEKPLLDRIKELESKI